MSDKIHFHRIIHDSIDHSNEISTIDKDVEIEIQEDKKMLCFICKKEGTLNDMVKPCTNEECKDIAHEQCLKLKVNECTEKGFCPSCNENTLVARPHKAYVAMIKLMYYIFMATVGSFTIFLHIVGKDLWDSTKNEGYLISVPILMIIVGFFIQLPRTCFSSKGYHIFHHKLFSGLRYKTSITVMVMFILTHIFVFAMHCLGYLIVTSVYSEREKDWYSTVTYGVGFIVILAFFIVAGVSYGALYSIGKCYKKAYRHFTNYGIPLSECEPLLYQSS